MKMSRNLNILRFLIITLTVYVCLTKASNSSILASTRNVEDCFNTNTRLDARDCSDYYDFGHRRTSGIYFIRPHGFQESFQVYCEMEKYGGGWTVIQRRGNYEYPENFFYKNWATYKKGFGDLELEFWLGNDKISALTKQGKYQVKVDVIGLNFDYYNFTYGLFKVENEMEMYKLSVGENSNTSSGELFFDENGKHFSTFDRRNDVSYPEASCATTYQGAWWYADCIFASNLNGVKSSIEADSNFFIYMPNKVALRYSQIMIKQ